MFTSGSYVWRGRMVRPAVFYFAVEDTSMIWRHLLSIGREWVTDCDSGNYDSLQLCLICNQGAEDCDFFFRFYAWVDGKRCFFGSTLHLCFGTVQWSISICLRTCTIENLLSLTDYNVRVRSLVQLCASVKAGCLEAARLPATVTMVVDTLELCEVWAQCTVVELSSYPNRTTVAVLNSEWLKAQGSRCFKDTFKVFDVCWFSIINSQMKCMCDVEVGTRPIPSVSPSALFCTRAHLGPWHSRFFSTKTYIWRT